MAGADRVAAVLLAAGGSLRFGSANKLLAGLDGQPLVSHMAHRLAAMGFGALIAVHSDGRVGSLLKRAGFETVHNGAPEQGLSRSLALGVRAAIPRDIDAVLLCLADMPHVPEAHFRALLRAFDPERAAIVASARGSAAMPPALFGRRHFAELCAQTGDRGARALLSGALLIPATAEMLRDIDRLEDLPGSADPS